VNNDHAVLLLEDGTVYRGIPFGARGTVLGEIVFNTAMSGYQEVLTDPSYRGQMVVMTYPHIGNYGINPEDGESDQVQLEALVVREVCFHPSNWRCRESLPQFLERSGVCGISEVDTRQLTRRIRERGAMKAILSSDGGSEEELRRLLEQELDISSKDLVDLVSCSESRLWRGKADERWYYNPLKRGRSGRDLIVAMDFGAKRNILRLFGMLGMGVRIVPADTSAAAIKKLRPRGVFLSNGPGDPRQVTSAIETVRNLAGELPLFGICLGHQILALALGAETFKLRFGHHGSNHPVKDLESGRIAITAQNHNFAVEKKSLAGAGLEATHINLNDGTIEGMRHREWPVFSVQFHPEAAPGPHDSLGLFADFARMLEKGVERI